ncbi:MAG: metal-dependent transcriptional regulator [Candidatus Eisenbacteria bacterium]|nr:metal-dependent transcriptional regulator [Candidatus Eisenbacteria bacterium]
MRSMEPEPMHSPTVENYLKALYLLAVPGRGVSTSRLASRLEIRAASVTHMLRRLADARLVAYERYRGATLTPEGERAATAVVRRHRILEQFLHRMCGLPLDQVHLEAEKLEHAASDAFVDALDRLLGHPVLDPHGDPIPDRTGRVRGDASHPLDELEAGTVAVVSRVEDSRLEALRHLVSLGLVPGARITLLRRLEFDGSVELQVGRTRVVLSRELARTLRVARNVTYRGRAAAGDAPGTPEAGAARQGSSRGPGPRKPAPPDPEGRP